MSANPAQRIQRTLIAVVQVSILGGFLYLGAHKWMVGETDMAGVCAAASCYVGFRSVQAVRAVLRKD